MTRRSVYVLRVFGEFFQELQDLVRVFLRFGNYHCETRRILELTLGYHYGRVWFAGCCHR